MEWASYRNAMMAAVAGLFAHLCLAAVPQLEPAFNVAQIESGAPKLEWIRNPDGSESTVLTKTAAGMDLADVKLTRRNLGDDGCAEVIYTLENNTKELRYASFGWRTSFTVADGNDSNWFPTTDNVIDLTAQGALWGFYARPGDWHFALVEPWFAAYNSAKRIGYAFLFDYNTLSAVYGASDMKVRGVLFDGGMLPPGASVTVKTFVRTLRGLPSLATVNEDFAAGFSGPPTSPALSVLAFRDLSLKGHARQTDVNGVKLGEALVDSSLKAGEVRDVCVIGSEKPETQSVLEAMLNGRLFEYFRENGFRMTALPLVPAVWPHQRPLPPKKMSETAAVKQEMQDKALLLFGFYANFFRFREMFPELEFTSVPVPPQGLADVPSAVTIGNYRYVFMGDVNEEGVRPMIARLVSYVQNGGTLVVGGGPFAYGCGGYTGTFLETILPVKTMPFDFLPACSSDEDGRTAVAFEGCAAKLFWIQRDQVKPGATVLLRTEAGDPLLVSWKYGKGRVFAFLGAPLGDEALDGKAFWNDNADYLNTMKGLLK